MADILESVRDIISGGRTVYIDKLPDSPDTAVCLYMSGSGSTHNQFAQTQQPQQTAKQRTFQVRVRAEKYGEREARETIEAITDQLNYYRGESAEFSIKAIMYLSGPLPIGRDDKERPEYTANFEIDYQAKQ